MVLDGWTLGELNAFLTSRRLEPQTSKRRAKQKALSFLRAQARRQDLYYIPSRVLYEFMRAKGYGGYDTDREFALRKVTRYLEEKGWKKLEKFLQEPVQDTGGRLTYELELTPDMQQAINSIDKDGIHNFLVMNDGSHYISRMAGTSTADYRAAVTKFILRYEERWDAFAEYLELIGIFEDLEEEVPNLDALLQELRVAPPTPTSPNKKALIIGISYRGGRNPLKGTIPDATKVRRLLIDTFGYKRENIKFLTDEAGTPSSKQPDRNNILTSIDWLMKDQTPGQFLFFYFSGHGTEVKDKTGVEKNGKNQAICPSDYREAGVITDSRLNRALVKPLKQGVTLHSLVDSCHSGTILNLPHNAVTKKGRFRKWENEYNSDIIHKMGPAGGFAIQFSSAQRDQSAYESCKFKHVDCSADVGAATYAFCSAIKEHVKEWNSITQHLSVKETLSPLSAVN